MKKKLNLMVDFSTKFQQKIAYLLGLLGQNSNEKKNSNFDLQGTRVEPKHKQAFVAPHSPLGTLSYIT